MSTTIAQAPVWSCRAPSPGVPPFEGVAYEVVVVDDEGAVVVVDVVDVEVVVVVDVEVVVEVVVAGGAVVVDVVWGGAVVVEVDADGPAFEGAGGAAARRPGALAAAGDVTRTSENVAATGFPVAVASDHGAPVGEVGVARVEGARGAEGRGSVQPWWADPHAAALDRLPAGAAVRAPDATAPARSATATATATAVRRPSGWSGPCEGAASARSGTGSSVGSGASKAIVLSSRNSAAVW
jgi:hypothetical protein